MTDAIVKLEQPVDERTRRDRLLARGCMPGVIAPGRVRNRFIPVRGARHDPRRHASRSRSTVRPSPRPRRMRRQHLRARARSVRIPASQPAYCSRPARPAARYQEWKQRDPAHRRPRRRNGAERRRRRLRLRVTGGRHSSECFREGTAPRRRSRSEPFSPAPRDRHAPVVVDWPRRIRGVRPNQPAPTARFVANPPRDLSRPDGVSDRPRQSCISRNAGLTCAASRHLLPKCAGFRISAVHAGGVFPASMCTRHCGSAVPMTETATTERASRWPMLRRQAGVWFYSPASDDDGSAARSEDRVRGEVLR